MRQTIWEAQYYGGQVAKKETVSLEPSPLGLRLDLPDGSTQFWRWDEVRQTQGNHRGDPVRLERGGDLGEAVVVMDQEFLNAVHDIAPEAARRFHHPARRLRNLWLLLTGSVAAILAGGVMYLWGVPRLASRVASRVPVSWEDELGGTVAAQLTRNAGRCEDREVTAAVGAIVQRLDSALPERRYRFRVTVVDNDVVNAFAAPGGHVVVFSGLLSRTATPEELAGILAHEMQHAQLRHGTQAILREVPLRLVLGAMSGDVSGLGSAAGTLGSLGVLRYQRRAEEDADSAGMDLMRRARINPQGMVDAFLMLERETGDMPRGLGYLSTHPPTAYRIGRMERMAAEAGAGSEALAESARWKQIAGACSGDR